MITAAAIVGMLAAHVATTRLSMVTARSAVFRSESRHPLRRIRGRE
jgi:hypothetical protein